MIIILLALGTVIRVHAAQGDLWLDEIWSIEMAKIAKSPMTILFGLHRDNNRYLNTAYRAMIGHGRSPILYCAAALAGSMVMMLVLLVKNQFPDPAGRIIWTLVTTASYLFTLYSSEARGYALALLFAILTYAARDRKALAG